MISRLLNPQRWSRLTQFFKQRAPRLPAARTSGIEVLESRIAPASVVSLSGSDLSVIDGVSGNDAITVTIINAGVDYQFTDPSGITAGTGATQVNGTTVTVPTANFSTLDIQTNGGTDSIGFASALTLTALTAVAETIGALPVLDIGSGGLSLTATTSAITIGGAITLDGAALISSGADLDVNATITKSSGGAATLDIRATGSITLNADITSTSGALSVILNADRDADSYGKVLINSGTTITTNGGDFTIGGGTSPSTTPVYGTADRGVYIIGSTITTDAGNISIRGEGSSLGANASQGIDLTTNTVIESSTGDITLVGHGGTGGGLATSGVSLYDNATVHTTAGGDIAITGTTGGTGTFAYGVPIQLGSKVETLSGSAGSITIIGVGGAGGSGSSNYGVPVLNNASIVSESNNPIIIKAVGGAGSSTAFITGTGTNNIGQGSGGVFTGDITIKVGTTMSSGFSGDLINLTNAHVASSIGALSITPMDETSAIGLTDRPATTVGIGTASSGEMKLSDAELDALQSGFTSITIGHSSGTGAVDIRTYTFDDATTIRGGAIAINGSLSTGSNDLTLISSGTITQNNIASIVQASNVNITAADVAFSGIIDAGTGNIDIKPFHSNSNIYLNNSGTGLNLNLADLLALRTIGGTITIGDPSDTGTVFIGGIGTVGLGLINADYVINGNVIDFNGGISIQDDRTLTLNSNNGITSGSGIDITIGGVGGTLVVTANDDVTLSTLITHLGATTITGGDFILSNNNSNLIVAAPLSADAISLTTGTATLTVNDNLTAANGITGNLTIIADGLALNDDISGGGILTIKGNLAATTIGIGDTATGTLNLGTAEVANITNGFTRINLGATIQTGAVDIVTPAGTPVTFHDPVYITASTTSPGHPPTTGSVEIEDGPLVGDSDASFNIIAKNITFSGVAPGITTNSEIINLNGAMLLSGNTTFDSSIGGAGGENITLTGTINGSQALVINADTAEVYIAGQTPTPASGTSVGGTTRLTTVDVTGGILRLQPNIATSGSQTYTGSDIRLLSGRFNTYDDATAAILFDGPVTLFNVIGISTNNSNITFTGAVTSEPTGKGGFSLASFDGTIAFNSDIGTVGVPLKSLSVTHTSAVNFGNGAGDETYVTSAFSITADEINFNGGDDSVHFAGALSLLALSADTAVLVGGAESVIANTLSISDDDIGALADGGASILISRTQGTAGFVISTASTFHDPVTFSQRTGGITQLNAALNADTANGGFLFRGPATQLNADITTAGGLIDIENGVVVTSTLSLDTSSGGGNIIVRGSLLSFNGGENLELNSGAGQIQLLSRIGSTSILQPVFGDVTLTASGDTRILKGITAASVLANGGGTTYTSGRILTTELGGQDYMDAVTLLGNSDFTSQDAFGVIHFFSTVNSAAGKTYNLSATNRTPDAIGSSVEFDANIGYTDRLKSIRINTTGNAVFDAGIKAASITTRSDGFTIHNADTTLGQSYVIGGTPSFLGTINTVTKLTINTSSNVANSAAWTVTGQAKIIATGASVTINGSGNHFGNISIRAGSATIVEDGNMSIFSAAITGTLNLTTNTSGMENGDLTQTGRVVASRLETSVVGVAGSITLDMTINRFAQIGTLKAGTSILLLNHYSGFTSLDDAISTTSGDIVLVANQFGGRGSFSATPTASITAGGGGRWTVYSYYGSTAFALGPDNYDFGGYPSNPFLTGNSLLYTIQNHPI